jgi:hypothetical protein
MSLPLLCLLAVLDVLSASTPLQGPSALACADGQHAARIPCFTLGRVILLDALSHVEEALPMYPIQELPIL